MKKIICIAVCVFALFTLFGCGTAVTSDEATITVTDHTGIEVVLPKNIERIAVCGIYPMPSVLTVFFNSADKLIAIPDVSMSAAKNGLLGELYPKILNIETECVSGDSVNTEELLLLDPDVVFFSASDTAIGEALRAAGFAAVGISVNKWDYNCIETLNNWIALLSEIFPANDKAETVKTRSNEMYDLVQERVSVLSDDDKADTFFLFQYSDTTMLTSGKNFFGQWWCDAVGAFNVAAELVNDNSVAVNIEQVYAWNPDIMLLTNFTKAQPDDIYTNTIGSNDWSGINAVISERVYKMPLGMYRSYTPGADTPVTLLWLAKTVYPELFEDIDITQTARDYYYDVFGIELADSQIEAIFTPVSDAANGIG